MEQSHILLVHHRRIGAWLPPGGHIEEYELPHTTAIRETKEETGIDIAVLNLDRIGQSLGGMRAENTGRLTAPPTRNENAFFLPTPLCVHAVKAREGDSDYYHIDLAYLCRPAISQETKSTSLPDIIISEEVHEARWVELSALSCLPLANNVVEIVALAKSRLNWL